MPSESLKRNLVSTLSGVLSGAATQIILHPLDTIKTRLQSKGRGQKIKVTDNFITSNVKEAREIYSTQGMKGFFSGAAASCLANSISWGLYFGVYSSSKDFYQNLFDKLQKKDGMATPTGLTDRKTQKSQSTLLLTLAGIQTGLVTTTITHPIWLVKTRMQLQPSKYHGIVDGMRKIAREEGTGTLYLGFSSSLMLMSHGIINFVSYDKMKQGYRTIIDKLDKNEGKPRDFNDAELCVLGAAAKALACVSTYPMQVIKTRIQDPKNKTDATVRYKGFLDATLKIHKSEGFFSFYRGLVPYLLRVTPQGMISFYLHEKMMKMFDNFIAKDHKI